MSLGKYFDKLKEVKDSNPESLKNEINLTIEEIKNQRAELIKECEEEKRDIPVERALRVILEQELVSLKWDNKCDAARRENIKNFISPESKISKDLTTVFLKPDVTEKLVTSISSDPSLYVLLKSYAMEKNPSDSYKRFLADRVAPKLIELFQELLPKVAKSLCPDNKTFNIDPKVMGKILLFQMARVTQNPCKELIGTNEIVSYLKDDNQCANELNSNVMIEAMADIMDVAGSVQIKNLLNPNSSYGDQVKRILTPGCFAKRNLIPVKNISCETRSTCNSGTGKCGDQAIIKEEFKTTVFEGVKEGRATGMIFCTAVLKDPKVRSGFCKQPVKGVKGHTNHVVAVSGYRCQKGKIEYEVTNSWGKTCPVENKGFKNSAIKCVLDSEGKPTGRFFMTEDALVSNLIDFNIVKYAGKK
jgi:hypothetical protein